MFISVNDALPYSSKVYNIKLMDPEGNTTTKTALYNANDRAFYRYGSPVNAAAWEIQIEKCPFCGGEAEIDFFREESICHYSIGCKNGNDCWIWPSTDIYFILEEAAEAWNKRYGG